MNNYYSTKYYMKMGISVSDIIFNTLTLEPKHPIDEDTEKSIEYVEKVIGKYNIDPISKIIIQNTCNTSRVHTYQKEKVIKLLKPFSYINTVYIVENHNLNFHKITGYDYNKYHTHEWNPSCLKKSRILNIGWLNLKAFRTIIDTDTMDYLIKRNKSLNIDKIFNTNDYTIPIMDIREDCITAITQDNIEIRIYKDYNIIIQKVKQPYYSLFKLYYKEIPCIDDIIKSSCLYKYKDIIFVKYKIKNPDYKPLHHDSHEMSLREDDLIYRNNILRKDVKPIDRIKHEKIYKRGRNE